SPHPVVCDVRGTGTRGLLGRITGRSQPYPLSLLLIDKSQKPGYGRHMVEADPFLTMQGIVKHFLGAKGLDVVDLHVRAVQVDCVRGQNGAGKSTLSKVLSGAHDHDAGQIRIGREEVTLPTPAAALRAGIATMYQELDVVAGLTVAENIFLGNERSVVGLTRRQDAAHAARDLLTRLGHPEISPYAEVGELAA